MSYLRILFFTFSLIFIVINHVTLFPYIVLEYLLLFLNENVDEEGE